MSDKPSEYPSWICDGCGKEHGKIFKGHLATFHCPNPNDPADRYGWCKSATASITEPRDYGYPPPPKS